MPRRSRRGFPVCPSASASCRLYPVPAPEPQSCHFPACILLGHPTPHPTSASVRAVCFSSPRRHCSLTSVQAPSVCI